MSSLTMTTSTQDEELQGPHPGSHFRQVAANRLVANSFSDLVVFGRQAADTTAELVKPKSPPVKLPAKAGEANIARMDKMRNAKGHIPDGGVAT